MTGGAGFLGSHLCEKLLDLEHEVICLDNFYTGRKNNIEHLFLNSSFEYIRQDVTESLNIEVDGIFNLACPASPVHYQRYPVETIKASFLGALNVLELAKRLKVPVLQASTSEVYGDPAMSPQSESYWGNVNPIGLRACYDEGKRAAESLFFDFHREFGVEIKIARIFNTYGPRMNLDDGRVVSNFVTQALTNQPITIYGDGNQTRSFCFVDDLIDGLQRLFFANSKVTGPINLGNPTEFTMLDLAQMILDMTESKSKIVFHSLPADDPKQRRPDITMAQKYLGWDPMISLREGLTRTIADFKSRL